MWKKWAKEYLTFTKKERVGVFVMLTIVLLAWVIPFFYSAHLPHLNDEELAELKKQQEKFKKSLKIDSIITTENSESDRREFSKQKYDEPFSGVLFSFDPNTVSEEGWRKLGLREKTITTIIKFISKGGKFYDVSDLQKIYGLRKEEFERLRPYVRIADVLLKDNEKPESRQNNFASRDSSKRNFVALRQIDINKADTGEWIALPGIGSKLAARIILFREKLGGFYSIEQVSETFGLADSVFQKLKTRFIIEKSFKPKLININSADVQVLATHPYIRHVLANVIVQFRTQHGNFESVEALSKLAVITPDLLIKIKPYLTAN